MGLFDSVIPGIIAVLVLLALIASSAIKVVQEYERGVIFRLGRLQGAKGPGLFFIIPIFDRMVKVDLRVVTLDIPAQEAITRDNVTVRVNAVAYFRVVNPNDAIVQVEDYQRATWQISQTSLRSVLGQSDLDELLIHRDEINQKLQKIIDEKRAKIIHAEGEFDAAQRLQDAASVIAQVPAAIQLRYLQTLTEIAVEKNSTIIFPVPIEFVSAFQAWLQKPEVATPE